MSDHQLDLETAEGVHEHIVTIPWYLGVFFVLLVGTIATYFAALYDLDWIFPWANTLVALAIAFFKMMCVVLIFMHVWWSGRLIGLVVVGSLFCLAIMFAFTMQDYLTRSVGTF